MSGNVLVVDDDEALAENVAEIVESFEQDVTQIFDLVFHGFSV